MALFVLCKLILQTSMRSHPVGLDPRTSTIVQFIYHFWSIEISQRILRNQKLTIGLDSYSRQFYLFGPHLDIYISLLNDCLFEIHKIAVCFPIAFIARSLQGH